MSVFDDYAFVVGGKTRREVVHLLECYRTPSELAKLLKVHPNVVTRILNDLAARDLVDFRTTLVRRKSFLLTKKGDVARQVLDNLIGPKTAPQVNKLVRINRNVTALIIHDLAKYGFITFMKNNNPLRRFYRLTPSGEAVREQLK